MTLDDGQLFTGLDGNGNRLHGFHIHRYHHALAFGKYMIISLGILPDQKLLKVKGRISQSGTFDQSLHLIFQVDRTQVIDLNSPHDCADSHHIPISNLV